MYKIEFTKEDIDNLGNTFNIAVKAIGLTNPDLVRFTLSVMDRCTVAILEADKKAKEKATQGAGEDQPKKK